MTSTWGVLLKYSMTYQYSQHVTVTPSKSYPIVRTVSFDIYIKTFYCIFRTMINKCSRLSNCNLIFLYRRQDKIFYILFFII